ncbi:MULTISPECIES: hypothetical protein [Klebsiella pneumoniae complex]|uniref:hypothetical protein n=1 Tax=Klebsiella pneumoniae complex TaxID=3390273 RepID=UPI0007CBE2AE|nr:MULTISPECIES: hypothetical protein [Klebsiella]SBH92307.1 Uncharacterised protein [Klebsiella pneumoniae]HBQ9084910.1 hypothetical protein [Klebsiella quasipneumoniae]HBQ9091126.1 hypothetical protein [Klebsiella quasipneumoniae]HBQ9096417.1 hypothetical protein [Klebsiella quasipneumoniae]HBQ9112771.1 hypothetical protein [Klebsiella quasipneumoniae]
MTNTNIHGLSRTIPADVKREIRQRCGFGCVICGVGFYDYEHFAPDFVDAKEHNPEGMTLLCPRCNQNRARGRLSRETVAEANKNPVCIRNGHANEMFDFHSEPIEISFAGVTFYDCTHLIMVNGRPILSVTPPPKENSPVLLSGLFCDSLGREALIINENEWSVNIGTWDVECVGPRITIRTGPGKIALILRMNAPRGIIIERLDMLFEGVGFRGNEKSLQICMDGKNWQEWGGSSISHFHVGIMIENGPKAANDPVWSYA